MGTPDRPSTLTKVQLDSIRDKARSIANDLVQEVLKAAVKHAPMHTPHEGISVIREEFEELWEHTRADTGRTPEARKEALQLAAMALRYVLDLVDNP